MSGVYIKGMEMPKGCAFCRIGKRNGKKMVCPLCDEEWDIHDPMSADHRLDNCPLVSVPPHGDLVDRAEILEIAISLLDEAVTDQEAYAIRKMWSRLGQMPVYIPAEEES